jgi:hypothetical protein
MFDKVAYRLMHRYNLTTERFEEMKLTQNSRCLSCGERKKLYIDHNHRTGEVRGLVCPACNLLIGFIERRGNRLGKVLHYLEAFPW